MKRSEMLEIIETACKNWQDCKFEPKMYKEILKAIEKAGMSPPIEPGRTLHDLDLGVPEWEPEKSIKSHS
jgi:hypothetical protein